MKAQINIKQVKGFNGRQNAVNKRTTKALMILLKFKCKHHYIPVRLLSIEALKSNRDYPFAAGKFLLSTQLLFDGSSLKKSMGYS